MTLTPSPRATITQIVLACVVSISSLRISGRKSLSMAWRAMSYEGIDMKHSPARSAGFTLRLRASRWLVGTTHTALCVWISSLSTSCGSATAADRPRSLAPEAIALQIVAESAVAMATWTPGRAARKSSSALGMRLMARAGETDTLSPSTPKVRIRAAASWMEARPRNDRSTSRMSACASGWPRPGCRPARTASGRSPAGAWRSTGSRWIARCATGPPRPSWSPSASRPGMLRSACNSYQKCIDGPNILI